MINQTKLLIAKRLLRFLKYIGIAVLSFVTFVLLYLLAAYVLSRISTEKEASSSNDVSIYILSNGVHTDLVMPLKTEIVDWSKEIQFAHTTGKDTVMQFVALGWGDKGFYLETPTWADLKFSTAFKAAFALSTSALHATFYKSMKEGKECVKIPISKDQYTRLVAYIQNSFDKDANGHYINIPTKAVYGANDAFYEAKGSYSLFQTCNTWANKGLKSCGQKAALWTPFDTGIFYHYNQNK
ncbi:TIGR02117 family protein [Flavisolibacter tropicus]|uniref:Urease-associated protein n=1 Tax=Flavisolibacter tropicus TaxID=1492898 RepID=A0A172TUF9_9BACT|nr:TIGR02117 family protein [Flavisolibacter tropicus]ANE50514.1 urease-associated protein [Flavisolibacter tropicus]